jgi:hypothetical protein
MLSLYKKAFSPSQTFFYIFNTLLLLTYTPLSYTPSPLF